MNNVGPIHIEHVAGDKRRLKASWTPIDDASYRLHIKWLDADQQAYIKLSDPQFEFECQQDGRILLEVSDIDENEDEGIPSTIEFFYSLTPDPPEHLRIFKEITNHKLKFDWNAPSSDKYADDLSYGAIVYRRDPANNAIEIYRGTTTGYSMAVTIPYAGFYEVSVVTRRRVRLDSHDDAGYRDSKAAMECINAKF